MINGFANRRLNPLGYTRFSVWDLWLRIYFNLQSQIQNQAGGLKGIQTLTRSLQDFYAVELHHQPEKLVSKAGFSPARVSFSQGRLNLVRLIIPPLRRKNKYRRWESNSQKLVSKTSAFAVWLRRCNFNKKLLPFYLKLVWAAGFKPAKTCSQGKSV